MDKNNEKPQSTEEKKIVNLCEDMRPHKHDEESYEKAKQEHDKRSAGN